jgi:uncharacterized protein
MSLEPATRSASRPRIGNLRLVWASVALALAGCAAGPPLNLYTLSDGSSSNEAATAADPPPSRGTPVIEVGRVNLPEYLDSQDLIVRRGDVLERSSTGRWATRLSIAATDLLTTQLTMRLPDAWVTDQPQARPPDYRLMLHIDRLDITGSGTGIVEADWELVPRGAAGVVVRRRIQFSMHGAVGTDEAVVHFERQLLDRLASEIDLNGIQWRSESKTMR